MSPAEGLRKAGDVTENVAENALFKLLGRASMVAVIPLFLYISDKDEKSLDRRFEAVEQQIDEQTSDRWTGTQAALERAIQDRRDTRQEATHQRDTDRLDSKLDTIEAFVRRMFERFGG